MKHIFIFFSIAVIIILVISCREQTIINEDKIIVENVDDFLSFIQETTFKYFYDGAHPTSGLILERGFGKNKCTAGATGFGLMVLMIGSEREFITREQSSKRALKILKFLDNATDRVHGAWSHWINGETGEIIPFSENDDGGDLVETSYLMQGILTIREYFDQLNDTETEIRQIADSFWSDASRNSSRLFFIEKDARKCKKIF